jgi:hypothetical protein
MFDSLIRQYLSMAIHPIDCPKSILVIFHNQSLIITIDSYLQEANHLISLIDLEESIGSDLNKRLDY